MALRVSSGEVKAKQGIKLKAVPCIQGLRNISDFCKQ